MFGGRLYLNLISTWTEDTDPVPQSLIITNAELLTDLRSPTAALARLQSLQHIINAYCNAHLRSSNRILGNSKNG